MDQGKTLPFIVIPWLESRLYWGCVCVKTRDYIAFMCAFMLCNGLETCPVAKTMGGFEQIHHFAENNFSAQGLRTQRRSTGSSRQAQEDPDQVPAIPEIVHHLQRARSVWEPKVCGGFAECYGQRSQVCSCYEAGSLTCRARQCHKWGVASE